MLTIIVGRAPYTKNHRLKNLSMFERSKMFFYNLKVYLSFIYFLIFNQRPV